VSAALERAARLIEGLEAGDRRAMSRAITAAEAAGDEGRAILRAIEPRLGRARLVGFTGRPAPASRR